MESLRLGLPTLLLILAYLAGINLLGAWIGRNQKDARDYFLGNHAMPWWAVMGSIVATETSALTFLSIPGDAYRSGFTFLQLVFGYVLGRIAVSLLLLPSYFKGELTTVRPPVAALSKSLQNIALALDDSSLAPGGPLLRPQLLYSSCNRASTA